jgi:hypothetical protein
MLVSYLTPTHSICVWHLAIVTPKRPTHVNGSLGCRISVHEGSKLRHHEEGGESVTGRHSQMLVSVVNPAYLICV